MTDEIAEHDGQAQQEPPEQDSRDTLSVLPVVGIGASAGGLEAFREFLEALPTDLGVCYVFVQHLDPDHKTMLTELLGKYTDMPVRMAEDGMKAEADQVLVIPPDSTLTLVSGTLRVQRPAPPRTHRTPIDSFFTSLGADLNDSAIAIVLSGSGSDGTQGMREVKEAGGFTIAQKPETAKYDSMPRNAIATSLVDQVLAPGEMARCIKEYLDHLYDDAKDPGDEKSQQVLREQLARICSHLKLSTGHDFRDYKEPTLVRRVQRRMQVQKISEIGEYIERLREDNREAQQLFKELLVSVTGFFRDPDAFAALEEKVIMPLVKEKNDGEPLRIWVPGCATGEEAYSIALTIRNLLDETGKNLRVQIFATDLDESALEVARRGTYPESIAAYVPEEYLKRYFTLNGGDYRISEAVRELCIFSTQSLVKDPPFSRLDLISCRNVLIYLKSELQNRLIPVFHYALRSDGFLFLGTSENVTRHGNLFEQFDKKWRIFRRLESPERPSHGFSPAAILVPGERESSSPPPRRTQDSRQALVLRAERAILDGLGPAYAVIDQNREVVYSGGPIEKYLKFHKGAPTLEIVAIAHESLRMEIRALIHRSKSRDEKVSSNVILFEEGKNKIRLKLECSLMREQFDQHLIITFNDLGEPSGSAGEESPPHSSEHVTALETELRTTREYLQTTTEELESSNEELKSANEELMSMNEELQSSNEELETSKEELQSVNEELETVNSELLSKVEDLARINGDLQNLLESTQIATLFLDRGMRVRRFTPVAKEIFNLIDQDLGRSINDITARVDGVDVGKEGRKVLDKLTSFEKQVTLRDEDRTFLMRVLPYRTLSDVIDGVVVTFVDITSQTKAQQQIAVLNEQLKQQVADLRTLLEIAPIGIAFVDDPSFENIRVNRHGARIMKIPRDTPPAGDPRASYWFEQNGKVVPASDLPLQSAWRTGKSVNDFRATFYPDTGEPFEYLMSAAPILDDNGKVRRVVGVFDDVSNLTNAQMAAETRAAQQDFVAMTGGNSLGGKKGDDLIRNLPAELAKLLEIDFCKILKLNKVSGNFSLVAAFGFEEPVGTSVPGGMDSQAGYTLHSSAPVIVTDLASEKRFSGPEMLNRSGVVSGVSVIIGSPDDPWGILGVHTKDSRVFTADDVKFLQSLANVLAATLQRDDWENQQRLLLDELSHRVKNSLATVKALAGMTFAKSEDDGSAAKNFLQRLQAMAVAHDLHFQSEGGEIEFGDLLQKQIEPFAKDGGRVTFQGNPGIGFPASTALDLAMVIHELVTNAAKYGALSENGGQIHTSWMAIKSDSGQTFRFEWREKGGPQVTEPTRQGVGSRLIQAVGSRPGTTIEREFLEDGLYCRIEIEMDDDDQRDGVTH